MYKIYIGMGCFWSTQYLFKKTFKTFKHEVGYSHEGIEILSTEYSSLNDLESILAFFFENQSFIIDRPVKYSSVIFYEKKDHYPILLHALNRYNQKIKLSGKLGESKTKILLIDQYIKAKESEQDYLEKNKTATCHLGFNGVYY